MAAFDPKPVGAQERLSVAPHGGQTTRRLHPTKRAPTEADARRRYHRPTPHAWVPFFEDKEEALPHGVGNELHPYEREHTKDRDKYQHQHNAERDYALLSSFASDVPRHALQCNRARCIGL